MVAPMVPGLTGRTHPCQLGEGRRQSHDPMSHDQKQWGNCLGAPQPQQMNPTQSQESPETRLPWADQHGA